MTDKKQYKETGCKHGLCFGNPTATVFTASIHVNSNPITRTFSLFSTCNHIYIICVHTVAKHVSFLGLMSKSTFKLDITSTSFVVKAEPAGLVLDLHMDMLICTLFLLDAVSGRFQLHICKIFQNVHDVSGVIGYNLPIFPFWRMWRVTSL